MKHMQLSAAALITALAAPALAQQPASPPPAPAPAPVAAPAPALAPAPPAPEVIVHQDGDRVIRVQVVKPAQVDIAAPAESRPLVVERRLVEGKPGEQRILWIEGQPNHDPFMVAGAGPGNLLFLDPAAAPPMVQATYLGVNCDPLDFDTAKLLGVPRGTGLNITYVAEGSPAAAAGLKPGDVLTKLDDQVLVNAEQLVVLIRTRKEGDAIQLHIIRGGEPMRLDTRLGSRELPDLAPGGMNLNRQWSVQQQTAPLSLLSMDPFNDNINIDFNIPAGELRWIADVAQDNLLQMMPQIEANQDIRAVLEHMQQQMHQQREEMRRMIEQMRTQLDLDLQDLRGNLHKIEDGPIHELQMQSQVTWNDGQHRIELTSAGQDRHLVVQTQDGEVLYDGAVPDNGQVRDLSPDVQRKVNELLNGGHLKLEFEMQELDRARPVPLAPAPQHQPPAVPVHPGTV